MKRLCEEEERVSDRQTERERARVSRTEVTFVVSLPTRFPSAFGESISGIKRSMNTMQTAVIGD